MIKSFSTDFWHLRVSILDLLFNCIVWPFSNRSPPRKEKLINRTCIVERLWSEYKEIWKINREKLAITEGAEISKKHIDTDHMKWTYNSIK